MLTQGDLIPTATTRLCTLIRRGAQAAPYQHTEFRNRVIASAGGHNNNDDDVDGGRRKWVIRHARVDDSLW